MRPKHFPFMKKQDKNSLAFAIGIDGNEANEVRGDIGERVGVNNYCFNLLWSLHKQAQKRGDLLFVVFLKGSPRSDLPPRTNFWKYEILNGKRFWILSRLLPRLLFDSKIDVFFSPNHYLPPVPFLPLISTIHDLGYLDFSGQFPKNQYWQLKVWSAISIIISKYIITPSIASKRDIVRHYSFASKKVSVIPHGLDGEFEMLNISNNVVRQIIKKYKINFPYIVFIGTIKPSKNVEGLLNAFEIVKKNYPKLKLVIVGPKGWMWEGVFRKIKNSKYKKDIIVTGFVESKEKFAILKGASVFTVPSLTEGFGMDVLCALFIKTPVVAGNIGSLPEVSGKAGILVDPKSDESIAKGILKVLEMGGLEYNKLIEAGRAQASKYSWEKCGKETLSVFLKAGRKKYV